MCFIPGTHVEKCYYFHFAMSEARELKVAQPVGGGMGGALGLHRGW